jgi:hypothetical protein
MRTSGWFFPANLRNSRYIAIMREILCVSECMDVDVVSVPGLASSRSLPFQKQLC